MADYIVTSGELTTVANAIREKNGTSSNLSWPNGFVSGISSGGGGSSDLTWILPEQTVTLVDQPVEITGLKLDLIPTGNGSVPLKMTAGGPTDYYGMIFDGESLQSPDNLISITKIDGKGMFAVTDGESIDPNTYTVSIAVF